ncbi:MAG: PTS sugar transporter subunit IIA [Gemmatimonadetes bacterium]|nr:MAG: PTS sugar transporter subunit IIA [Gemmatimonadota bacterium]
MGDAVREPHGRQRNGALRTRQPVITFRARHTWSARSVRLREFFSEDAIKLDLQATNKDAALKELVGLLKLDDKADAMLFKMLKRRETLGSTGIGQGIAIPHCRSLVVNRLRVAFGRRLEGVDFKAIDDRPVHYFFLIVAPPLEVSNQYLPVLGKIAQFAKESDVPTRLAKLKLATEFLELLEEKNI